MMGEPTMMLSDLCDLVALQVDPSSRADQTYVGLEHVASGRFVRSGEGKASDVQSSKYAFQPGDVLYGKLRPYLDKAVLARDAGICTTELLVLRPKEDVDPQFLVSVVHAPSFLEHAVSGTTGVQHPRTSWNHISNFELPRFGPDEQRKISSLLWGLHDAISANETAIEVGTDLKRAAMRSLFTRGLRGERQKESEIGQIPDSWVVQRLGAHYSVFSGGTPSRNDPAYWSGGTIPWVKTAEVDYCVIRDTEEHITQAGLDRSAAKLLPAGTLLLAMYGQGITRGRVAILGVSATCNQACAALTAADEIVDSKYLYHFLAYRYDDIRQLAHGGQQQNLNLDIVRDLPVIFSPDLKEQQQIVAVLDSIDGQIDLHRRKRLMLDELFKALLHKLITGDIRVADLDLSALEAKRLLHE
jgi:type I restriction enzyme S subunit